MRTVSNMIGEALLQLIVIMLTVCALCSYTVMGAAAKQLESHPPEWIPFTPCAEEDCRYG